MPRQASTSCLQRPMRRTDQHDSGRKNCVIQRDSGREQQAGGNRNGVVLSNKPVCAREPWPNEQPMSRARKHRSSRSHEASASALAARMRRFWSCPWPVMIAAWRATDGSPLYLSVCAAYDPVLRPANHATFLRREARVRPREARAPTNCLVVRTIGGSWLPVRTRFDSLGEYERRGA